MQKSGNGNRVDTIFLYYRGVCHIPVNIGMAESSSSLECTFPWTNVENSDPHVGQTMHFIYLHMHDPRYLNRIARTDWNVAMNWSDSGRCVSGGQSE